MLLLFSDLSNRTGSKIDVQNLSSLWKQFGFSVSYTSNCFNSLITEAGCSFTAPPGSFFHSINRTNLISDWAKTVWIWELVGGRWCVKWSQVFGSKLDVQGSSVGSWCCVWLDWAGLDWLVWAGLLRKC